MSTLVLNQELNGIEISFDNKPAQAIIDSLKGAGFRWHRAKKTLVRKEHKRKINACGKHRRRKDSSTQKSGNNHFTLGALQG